MNSLLIVESPAKARTLNKILGTEFEVKASVGHIKDLPGKELGVDPKKDFEPVYVTIPGKEKIIRELKAASKKAQTIYLAPDPDREGEAIAYHIAGEISGGKDKKKIFRVTFHEITEKAVREAISRPGEIDIKKVDAQQARRVLDRLVGYGLSPLLWRKVRRGLSAGRVQSVAVRLVVEREREIEAFKKEEYWSIEGLLEGNIPPAFPARLYSYGGNPVVIRDQKQGDTFLLRTAAEAEKAAESLRGRPYSLTGVEKRRIRRMPLPPFITSTLQQEAVQKFGFTAKRTMGAAQQLYEGVELGEQGSVGLITYMRTDSVNVAAEAQQWARKLIAGEFGEKYVPEKPPRYRSKESAQEAHEAIRPTYMDKPPALVKAYLSKDHFKLYSLIWQRFLASQMSPAEVEQTTFTITAGSGGQQNAPEAVFRASGTVIKFDGYMALYKEEKKEEPGEEGDEGNKILPALKEGDALKLLELKPGQHFTQPPPRYSEATLVKTLEEKGIGRPSTYATILSTIQDRKYVKKEAGRFSPTDLGVVVNELLVQRFPELLDVSFTARMEKELDEIESGKMKWVKVIKEFYKPFNRELEDALKSTGKVKPEDVPTGEACEKCGKPMVKRWGRHGWFLACSGYPGCRNTRPLEGAEPVAQMTEEVCEKCGGPMMLRSGRYGKFLACSNYPECKSTKPVSLGVKCPLDGGNIVERRSKKGKPFYSCSNYPKCKFAIWFRPLPKACPLCGSPYLLERKNRDEGLIFFCPNKECSYRERPAGKEGQPGGEAS